VHSLTLHDGIIPDKPASLPVASRVDCLNFEQDLDFRSRLCAVIGKFERW
jgi:hypothetical protein